VFNETALRAEVRGQGIFCFSKKPNFQSIRSNSRSYIQQATLIIHRLTLGSNMKLIWKKPVFPWTHSNVLIQTVRQGDSAEVGHWVEHGTSNLETFIITVCHDDTETIIQQVLTSYPSCIIGESSSRCRKRGTFVANDRRIAMDCQSHYLLAAHSGAPICLYMLKASDFFLSRRTVPFDLIY
jgi:hypothetical protein